MGTQNPSAGALAAAPMSLTHVGGPLGGGTVCLGPWQRASWGSRTPGEGEGVLPALLGPA